MFAAYKEILKVEVGNQNTNPHVGVHKKLNECKPLNTVDILDKEYQRLIDICTEFFKTNLNEVNNKFSEAEKWLANENDQINVEDNEINHIE